MKDIIALAKEAGLGYLFPEKIIRLSDLLEAEIRKEFEVAINFWKTAAQEAATEFKNTEAALDTEREIKTDYGRRIDSLTAQNAKLMEALKHCHEVFVKYEINRIDGDEISDKAISIIMEALTPQPEKEGKE